MGLWVVGCGVWSLRFRVRSLGLWVWGLGFVVCGLGFGVWGLGFGVWGLRFGSLGLGFWVWGFRIPDGAGIYRCTYKRREEVSDVEFQVPGMRLRA